MTPNDGSARSARLAGLREAFSAPALVMGASYLGFGSLVRASGMPVEMAVYSTVTGWALPGQVVAVEMAAAGASLLAIGFAVGLANARLLPLVLTLLPALGRRDIPRWRLYAVAHLIAVTSWVYALRRFPDLHPGQRLSFLVCFAGSLWTFSIAMSIVGYFLAGTVPAVVSLGLVFLNPIYFMLLLSSDLRNRCRVLAILAGAVLAPPLTLVSPDWGLMAAGLAAGTLAFAVDRRWRRRAGPGR